MFAFKSLVKSFPTGPSVAVAILCVAASGCAASSYDDASTRCADGEESDRIGPPSKFPRATVCSSVR